MLAAVYSLLVTIQVCDDIWLAVIVQDHRLGDDSEHDQWLTLYSFDAVDTRGSFLASDHPVSGGEEHVLGSSNSYSVHGQLVCVGVPCQ